MTHRNSQKTIPFVSSSRSRRRFLMDLGCASLGTATLYSSLTHLGAISAAAQTGTGEDYRALVCLLQAGGNDSFNMLVPTQTQEYGEYAEIRRDLALASGSLLPLADSGIPGRTFGVHPGMPETQQLYDQGSLAFVANVGTLVQPTTLAEYEAGVGLPIGLFSHSDQIQQWQTSTPDLRGGTGWGGRLADTVGSLNENQEISMNISVAGSNLFQNGVSTVEFAVSPSGEAVSIAGYEGEGLFNQIKTTAIDSLLNEQYVNLFEAEYAHRLRASIDSTKVFQAALESVPALTTIFSAAPISQSLQMVARTISARQALGQKRQTFFVLFGGWDHHDDTLDNQAFMLPQLSLALREFYDATVELGLSDKITTFTISDFGRTLTSNGRGSDHGWGGNQIVMGDAVAGSKIYGDFPSLYEGNPLDTGRGRLIPTTSVDEYFAEMALWYGVDPSSLDLVLPNIERFYDPYSGTAPIGFMG